jgi:hypothetical protein
MRLGVDQILLGIFQTFSGINYLFSRANSIYQKALNLFQEAPNISFGFLVTETIFEPLYYQSPVLPWPQYSQLPL